MSWLGSSLTNIGGQISNFTRDVLTEGTEEVTDHFAEFKVAKERLLEFETQSLNHKAEIERLKYVNGDLEEKAESAELQINSISKEYRALLEAKEVENNVLKQKHNELLEIQQKTRSAGFTDVTIGRPGQDSNVMPPSKQGYHGDEMDFNDVIASQHEINRLSNEVRHLQAELYHWKHTAERRREQNGSETDGGDELQKAQLEIREIRKQLTDEVDQHQRHLSALQDVHSQKISSLQKQHRNESMALQEELAELQTHLDDPAGLPNQLSEHLNRIKLLNEQLAQNEAVRDKMATELDLTQTSEKDKTRKVQLLARQLEAIQLEKQKLNEENETLKYRYQSVQENLEEVNGVLKKTKDDLDMANQEIQQKDTEMKRLQKLEKQDVVQLQKALDDAQQRVILLQEENSKVCTDLTSTREKLLAVLEAEHASASGLLKDVQMAREAWNSETTDRRTDLVKEKKILVDKLVQAGAEKCDIATAVELMEKTTKKTTLETHDIIQQLGDPDQQELTASMVEELELENASLKQTIIDQEAKIFELEKSVEFVSREKNKLEEEMKRISEDLHALRGLKRSESEKTLELTEDDRVAPPSGRVEAAMPFPSNLLASTPQVDSRKASTTPSIVSFDGEFDNVSIASSSISEISVRNKQLDDQVGTLQNQIERYEHEIEHFELVRSDWQNEKESLENVLGQLRGQLNEKENSLNLVQAKKGLAKVEKKVVQPTRRTSRQGLIDLGKQTGHPVLQYDVPVMEPEAQHELALHDEHGSAVSSDTEADIAEWNHQLDLLTQANADLENERDILLAQKDDLEREFEKFKLKNAELETSEKNISPDNAGISEEDVDKELQRMKQMLEEKQIEVAVVTAERDSMVANLEELDAQHQEAIQQIINVRDSLVGTNDDLKSKSSQLEEKVSQSFQQNDLLAQEVRTLKQVEREKEAVLGELKTILNESTNRVKVLSDERDSLANEVSSLNMSYNDSLNTDNDLSMEISALQDKLNQSDAELRSLVQERNRCSAEIDDLKRRLETGAHALNELHMDKKDLEATISNMKGDILDLNEKQAELKSDKIGLERTCGEMEVEVQRLQGDLKSFCQQRDDNESKTHDRMQADIANLKEKLRSSSESSQTYQEEIDQVKNVAQDLEIKIEDLNSDKEGLQRKLDLTESDVINQKEELNERYKEYTDDLLMQIDALKSEKQTMEKELDQAEHRLRDQMKQYESYVHDVSSSRSLDDDALQAGHEKLLKLSHEKDVEIGELQEHIQELQSELEDSKDMLQSAIDGQKPLADLVQEKEQEISSLTSEKDLLTSQAEENSQVIREQRDLLEGLRDVDKQLRTTREENRQLHIEISGLRQQLDNDKVDSKTLDIITDLESEITNLNSSLKEDNLEIRRLQKILGERDASIDGLNKEAGRVKELEDQLHDHDKKLKILRQELVKKDEEIALTKLQLANSLSNQTVVQQSATIQPQTADHSVNNEVHLSNGDVNDETDFTGQSRTTGREMEKLRKILQDKDTVIEELQRNNNSLLKMLEDQSVSTYGNRVLVDLHKQENQVKSLQIEREQIMAILNEKSRECSSLKLEVHRLMNVVSAEKTAIAKLQEDNKGMVKTKETHEDYIPDDMSKEAIKNLSRIIRDKDMEMEALKQKNETLLLVLQDSSKDGKQIGANEGSQVQALLQERENLVKQIQAYANDREQLIATVTQKHQESLSFHAEVQRLSQHIAAETDKCEKTKTDYDKIVQQFEDKQQALVKAQNELANYKQKFTELDTRYQEVMSSQDGDDKPPMTPGIDSVEMTLYKQKCDEVNQVNETLRAHAKRFEEKSREAQEKDQVIGDLNGVKMKHEEMLSSKDIENNMLRKQIEKLNFELEEVKRECADLKTERESCLQRLSEQQSENEMMKESLSRTAIVLKDKDFELKAMREKIETLTKLVHERTEQGKQDDINRVLTESESMQKQAQTFQQERDQVMLALKQRQQENTDLQNQVLQLRDRELKLKKELERLRSHLLQIEDGYTEEAVQAEEREKELRNRLAGVEKEARNSTSAVQMASQQANEQLGNIQEQLHNIASQRDDALIRLSTTQDQLRQYAAALQNLQVALEQFQGEKAVEVERHQDEINQHQTETLELKVQLAESQNRLLEASNALEAAHRLHEQLDRKEEAILALKNEVQLRENALKDWETKVHKLNTVNEGKVDKAIVKSLFVGYFSIPVDKRKEVIKLIGRVLDFNREEMDKVGVGERPVGGVTSWLPSILRRSPAIPKTPTSSRTVAFDKSFSELFVNFLETESTPKPKVKLPVDKMVQEDQLKHHRPAFNPFSAPRHAAIPLQLPDTPSGGKHSQSHILMNPASPVAATLPVFTPLPPGGATGVLDGATGTGSGRSTPSTAGNILQNVLRPAVGHV